MECLLCQEAARGWKSMFYSLAMLVQYKDIKGTLELKRKGAEM
jgi:hypothetical protein